MKPIALFLAGMTLSAAVSANAATFTGDRADFRDETIYFAITTRFYDGDPSNNSYCWDGRLNVNDPEWRGDFKGLISKLDYIKALGFTAVLITPVVQNASGLDYHGYHAMDFSKVDRRYLSEDCSFRDLVDAVHARDMRLVLDVVLQHTGNFGEEMLCPMFERDFSVNQSNMESSMKRHPQSRLPENYSDLPGGQQYAARLALMKNTDGRNNDVHNYWHHVGNNWNWDDASRWWGQIAGDCVDLNTEHPTVYNYLIDCYKSFIEMGVDAFRIDTGGHIPRLTFNKAFLPGLQKAAEGAAKLRGGRPFFMYTEVCARSNEVIYRNENYNCSPCFYTWKETKDYAWDTDPSSWDAQVIKEGEFGTHVNALSVLAQGKDYSNHASSILSKSNNHLLDGNKYHAPDHSQWSGLSVIDFPMHWRFGSASNAFGVRSEDNLYCDATYNVVYVDSHDYGPDGQDRRRFEGGTAKWAENLDLIFTWRGIPCLFYGSEIEFRAGATIDEGPNLALRNSGRAYFGGYIEGDVKVNDFASYTDATGNMAATLANPLALHIQRLNQLRAAIPALRRGQYSTEGCKGTMAFKRRYTDATTDSYVLVTISGDATFSGVENGRYVDAITGDVRQVTDGTLATSGCKGTGAMRVYVLDTKLTPAPGKVGRDGRFLYTTAPVVEEAPGYDGNEEPDDTTTQRDNAGGGGSGTVDEPATPETPSMAEGEQGAFFENTAGWGGTIKAWVWSSSANYTGGSWPGQACRYLGNGVWKWTYGGSGKIPDTAKIIFSNGSQQTEDLPFANGGYYDATGYVRTIDGAGEIPDDPELQPGEQVTWRFWYNDTNFAPDVYAYVWDAGNSNRQYLGAWPGTKMTVDDATGYHTISFTTTDVLVTPKIIFNNGKGGNGNQTADLDAENGGIYNAGGLVGSGAVGVVSDDVEVSLQGRTLVVWSRQACTLPIYRVDGTYATATLRPGRNAVALAPGFYIAAGRKLAVR